MVKSVYFFAWTAVFFKQKQILSVSFRLLSVRVNYTHSCKYSSGLQNM
jgi:hypothetical protein